MQKHVLLLIPPANSIQGPPLGIAAVAGYLRENSQDVDICVEDLNARVANTALNALPRHTSIHKTLRSRWTGAEIVQDALSKWAFGSDAPGCTGTLPDWERHHLALLFGEELNLFVAAIEKEPDIIGISVSDNGFIAAIGLTRRLKCRFNKALVVWGGVAVTAENASLYLAHIPELDIAVVGEGEKAFLEIVSAYPKTTKNIPSIITRSSNSAAKAPRVNYLPSEPAFDLFDLNLYSALELPVSIARGCAWGRCSFCNENYAASEFQPIDPERSARWALEWQSRFNPVSIELIDSAANSNPKLFKRFVACLLEGGGLREWRCMLRTKGIVKEDLERAALAGLRTIYFGFESFDDGVLSTMCKGARTADHLRAITMALELGIRVEGDIILFFPTDTAKAIRNTIKLVRQYQHLFSRIKISYSRFVPGLQSEIARSPRSYGIELISMSQRLGRHLPSSLAKAFIPWDPHWRFVDRKPAEVTDLSASYLELDNTLSSLKPKKTVSRLWYEQLSRVVLETHDHIDNTLDRVFLEGKQKQIWEILAEPRSSAYIASRVNESQENISQFAFELSLRGYLFGHGKRWTRVALHAKPDTFRFLDTELQHFDNMEPK